MSNLSKWNKFKVWKMCCVLVFGNQVYNLKSFGNGKTWSNIAKKKIIERYSGLNVPRGRSTIYLLVPNAQDQRSVLVISDCIIT